MGERSFHRYLFFKEYTPHICRSAATSKASQLNVDIAEILKEDCLKNAKTFFNFYKKGIVYYAPEDVDFMSILTPNIYDHMLFIFTISACKAKCIYIYSAHLICLTCSMHNFNRPIRKFWSKY